MVAQMVKNLPAVQETRVQSLGCEDSLEKGMATPVFFPGEFHGERSLMDYSPRGHKESNTTEQLICSILQLRRLKPREVKSLAQGHRVGKC